MGNSKPYMIPLYSGIGNIIQSIPFMIEMKKRYGNVVGGVHAMDFPESPDLVVNILDAVYDSIYSGDFRVALVPRRRHEPEYKTWFIDNKEKLPDRFSTDGIAYVKMRQKHKVIIWPECKPNWPCKRWPYFDQLAAHIDNVAIIGLEKDKNFETAVDYRNKLSLLETGGIIKNASIFIGNEGGMAHYAAALGIKTYIIMGCTDPVKCLPPNNAVPISLKLNCQPCQMKNMKLGNDMRFAQPTNPNGVTMIGCDDQKCIKDLSVKKVLEIIS